MLWSIFCPASLSLKKKPNKTFTPDPSCLWLRCCMHYCYIFGAQSGRQEQSKGGREGFPVHVLQPWFWRQFVPALVGGKKVPRGWTQKTYSWTLEPKACVTGSKSCSFKPLPKHTETVKQTETQEWRKQTENQAGCCSVVKQCP